MPVSCVLQAQRGEADARPLPRATEEPARPSHPFSPSFAAERPLTAWEPPQNVYHGYDGLAKNPQASPELKAVRFASSAFEGGPRTFALIDDTADGFESFHSTRRSRWLK